MGRGFINQSSSSFEPVARKASQMIPFNFASFLRKTRVSWNTFGIFVKKIEESALAKLFERVAIFFVIILLLVGIWILISLASPIAKLWYETGHFVIFSPGLFDPVSSTFCSSISSNIAFLLYALSGKCSCFELLFASPFSSPSFNPMTTS